MEMKSSNYIIQVMDLNVNGDYKTKYQQIQFELEGLWFNKTDWQSWHWDDGLAGVIICYWFVTLSWQIWYANTGDVITSWGLTSQSEN